MNRKAWLAHRGADFWTALVLMVFSGAVIREALNLGVGTAKTPGSGFMIFGTAVVLGVMASVQFAKSLRTRDEKTGEPPEKIHLWRVVSVIAANVLYIAVLDWVGFILCTFILLCFLLQVYEKGKWVWAVAGAAATSVLTYLIFAKLLQLNLPKGLIPFF
jgi:putative tricarboxylic transport membrane protein